jgi:hypothetical protein
MRTMNIPAFPRRLDNPDLGNFLTLRLSQPTVLSPDRALPLVCYMAWPNDLSAREEGFRIIEAWQKVSLEVPPRLSRIQHEWLRVADVLQWYCDLVHGQHQLRRGGPSIGKAITLCAAKAQSWGTSEAKFWLFWKKYKDVAHLITAASLICFEVRNRCRENPPGPLALSVNQFLPFQMVMLMPDLVLAVALSFQETGLKKMSIAREEPAFDPETLWRIPSNINVVHVPYLIRNLGREELEILNARRAGNRGNKHPRGRGSRACADRVQP